MTHPMMAVNPVLTASVQQGIPLVPSPFGPPILDRDVLSSTIAPADPRQFCVPSQFGSSVLPNATIPSMLSSRFYSGWGILPPESIKAMTRRNEMIKRHHTARAEMKMYTIYQQRRMERAKPKEFTGLGVPFLYGSSGPDGPTAYHGRSVLPASDLNLHRSTLGNLQGNSILVATEPHFTESWGQKYHPLRSTGNQKHVDQVTESYKSQAEEKLSHIIPYEDPDDYAKDPEREVCDDQKSRGNNEKPTTALANPCGDFQPTHRGSSSLEDKAWDGGKKSSEHGYGTCDDKNVICQALSQPSLPGTCALGTTGESHPLDEDIQKWTIDDVHNFIRSLPGCSDYAQVSQHVGSMFYKKTPSLPTQTRQAFSQPADTSPLVNFNSWSDPLSIPCSQDIMISKVIEQDNIRN
uniref:Sterile alpha motif domain containing 7 n=1 Tax=Jaculus jaculus TaxID=51337 RepID=A0A8C5LGE3_JACJA